ncbi:hypothetical protein C808_02663 [Lachnospiraceae bacterium M18-1]|nr:hypothetical protein C808_02663 [Lachnospiraceae bacterium M18-1]
MYQKTKKKLWVSFLCLIIICIVIFAWMYQFLGEKNEETVTEIGMIYMSEMNRQLEQKYSTIIELRRSQVEGILKRTSPENVSYGGQMLEEMRLNASVRNATYMGFYRRSGESELIYGNSIEPENMEEFQRLLNGEIQVASSLSEDGKKMIILGMEADYPMNDGGRSELLVVGFYMEDLEKALVTQEENALVYTHIIQADGSFVVRNRYEGWSNYYDYMENNIDGYDGMTSDDYVEELQNAIQDQQEFSELVQVGESHRHIYCTPLPGSDWYLVSVMPYDALDQIVSSLGEQRVGLVLGACGAVIFVVLIVFAVYLRVIHQQMEELDRARKDAIHANQAKSEFLSNMSHDIRTPMNGIVGMTAIAMANIHDPVRVQDCLKKVTLSSKHLLGLINDVLDMSKIEDGKLSLNMDALSLRDTMDSIVNIVQPQIHSKKQHFDIFVQKIQTEDVYCDGVRLNQVLLNLLSNAIKFTPEDGRINIYLTQEESPVGKEYVRCHFRVKDTGIGMSPEFMEKVFDSFTRDEEQVRKIEGTGLGMAITKCIVEAMKGTIEVQSEQNKGTEFHVILDFEKADTRVEDMLLPSWNMLVVDNNEELCQSAVHALGEIGVNAEWSVDGEHALEMVKARRARHDDYQVILLDWKMPGMDGLQMTREIRKIMGDEIPILIISAYDWSDIEEEALAAGAHGFISKPLFKSNLYVGLSKFAGETLVPEEKADDTHDFTGKRILLAEDNDLNWEIAEDLLLEVGFKVNRAENGQICVEMFEQSEVGEYDVILMDIRMPVMNGYEAAKAIRALERPDVNLPIIAMTADAFSDDVQHCLDSGMNAHIAKPIDMDKLLVQLEKYIEWGESAH